MALCRRAFHRPLSSASAANGVHAPTRGTMAATAFELVWGDGVVPSWLVGLTLLFLLLMPILRSMFPKTCGVAIKQGGKGAFLLAFEITCAGPVGGVAHDGALRLDH
jgi:hypothetical protein